eukprot:2385058-Amphidinium_carterae.1
MLALVTFHPDLAPGFDVGCSSSFDGRLRGGMGEAIPIDTMSPNSNCEKTRAGHALSPNHHAKPGCPSGLLGNISASTCEPRES